MSAAVAGPCRVDVSPFDRLLHQPQGRDPGAVWAYAWRYRASPLCPSIRDAGPDHRVRGPDRPERHPRSGAHRLRRAGPDNRHPYRAAPRFAAATPARSSSRYRVAAMSDGRRSGPRRTAMPTSPPTGPA